MTAPAPRKPQDHKPKAADEKPAGWDLLKPFEQVPVWDQTDLIKIVQPLLASEQKDDKSDDSGDGVDMASFDFDMVAQLSRKLIEFAIDKDKYVAFVSGPGALERAMELGIAYATQLGE